jgi:hypothetical protein
MRLLRAGTVLVVVLVASMGAVGGAQALVVNVAGAGPAGVSLVPGTDISKLPAAVSPVASAATCRDPLLNQWWPDLPQSLTGGLCFNGGSVLHGTETFALTWDPGRTYWQGTRAYVEQFLRDVADASGSLGSPYAVVSQYADSANSATGRASSSSLYGGGAIDFGAAGGFTANYVNALGSGTGHDFPGGGGSCSTGSGACLTDADIQGEVTAIVRATNLNHGREEARTPEIVVLTPPSVGVCMDAAGTVCSANINSPVQFCSYHAQLTVDGTPYVYLVQPWITGTACKLSQSTSAGQPSTGGQTGPTLSDPAQAAALSLVGPLSQSQIAAVTNPWLNGWYAADGSEINDNGGCASRGLLPVTLGSSRSYPLPPQFNNGSLLQSDPNVPTCAYGVGLSPQFVVPSAVSPGDEVWFDGSISPSTLVAEGSDYPWGDPRNGYAWTFGDGTTAVGPSVQHTYTAPGTYTVTLTVIDRGGNKSSISQAMQVVGPAGTPNTPSLAANVQLIPQSLRAVLKHGIRVVVNSNQPADGFTMLSIPRAAARRIGLQGGPGRSAVIGRGTISGIKSGNNLLHLRLSRTMAGKLRRLGHVTLTVRVYLLAPGGRHLAVDVAGRY